MKKILISFAILLALLLGVNNYVYSMVENGKPGQQKDSKPQYVPGEVLVKFKEGADPQVVLAEVNLEAQGIERIHSIEPAAAKFKKDYKVEKDSNGWYPFLGKQYKEVADIPDEEAFNEAYKTMPETEKALYRSYKIKLPEGISVEEAITQLKNNPDVEYAEPDYIVKAQAVPNDPYYFSSDSWRQGYDDLWGVKKIQCEAAWDISQGEGIVVAVIDTGVDYTHPDLSTNMWHDVNGKYGYDFANNDDDPMDDVGHGTHVAGTIAAVGNNGIGIIGVAPRARIMAVKGLGKDGSGSVANLVKCVIYAANNGARVLNNSWGGEGTSQTLTDAFRHAYQKGCVAIAAAGNDYGSDVSLFMPANIYSVIAVSASNPNDEICDFSNIGEKIDTAAPGGDSSFIGGESQPYVNILSLRAAGTDMYLGAPGYIPGAFIVGNDYYRSRGTSMACPHAAGVAALVCSRYPGLTNDQVRRKMITTTDDLGEPGKDIRFGYGRLNARNALLADIDIFSPVDGSFAHKQIPIEGAASTIAGFKRYELWYALLDGNGNRDPVKFHESAAPIQGPRGVLGVWDTAGCEDGKYLLTLKIIFSDNYEIKLSINVNVDNVNQPPEFKDMTDKIAIIGKDNYFKIRVVDPDDPLTPEGKIACAAYNLPVGAQFYPSTNFLFWKPAESQKGAYTVTFEARDNKNTGTTTMALSTAKVEQSKIRLNPELDWENFDIHGDRIVLEASYYDINKNKGGSYIYLYDLTGKKMSRLMDGSHYRYDPRIYGDKIVWAESRGEYGIGIYAYDLSMKKGVTIIDDQDYHQRPAIYEDKVVWNVYRDRTSYIYMYDLSANAKIEISAGRYGDKWAEIYGDKIVWEGGTSEGTNWDILMYDLSTNRKIPVCALPGWQRCPRIDGDKIVWFDERNGTPDIYIYDIPTGIERKITGEGGLPDIYDKNIVWRGYGDNGYGETYFYDLSKEKELRITDNMTYETLPRVYENTIAWFHFNSPDDWPVPTHLCVAKVFFVPRIISIEPAEILPGALLIIEGIDFGYDKADSQVRFVNGAAAGIETWSNVRITCRVPKNAKSGPLKVVTKGGNSNPIDVTILIPPPLPAAPKGLTGAVISGSQIDLRWEKGIVTDIVSLFKIERKDTYNGPYKEIASVPGSQLTYSNTGLGCGTNYYYRVRAMNSTGYSGCSNILVISIPTLPASPKNLTAAATTFYGQPLVRLKWSEPLPPGDKIYIERKTGSGGTYGVIAEVSAMTVLKYDDYKVTKGTKYYYRVRSRNINGYSAYSNEASVN